MVPYDFNSLHQISNYVLSNNKQQRFERAKRVLEHVVGFAFR